MKKIAVLSAIILVAGLLVAALAGQGAKSRDFIPPGHRTCSQSRIDPQNMVTLDDLAEYSSFGEIEVIYEVPDDMWFVITDITMIPFLPKVWNRPDSALVELDGEEVTVKRSACFFIARIKQTGDEFVPYYKDPFYPRPGIAFAPGTKVALRNESDPNPGSHYHINGYLQSW